MNKFILFILLLNVPAIFCMEKTREERLADLQDELEKMGKETGPQRKSAFTRVEVSKKESTKESNLLIQLYEDVIFPKIEMLEEAVKNNPEAVSVACCASTTLGLRTCPMLTVTSCCFLYGWLFNEGYHVYKEEKLAKIKKKNK